MKKLIFYTSLIITSLMLGSCKITQEGLWGAKIDEDESIKDFLINSDGSKIIVIGTKYHYLVNDEKKEVRKILMWDGKEKLETGIGLRAKGLEAEVEINFEAKIKDFSKNQLEFIKSLGDSRIYDFGNKISIPRLDLKGTRVVAVNDLNLDQDFVSTGLIKTEQDAAIFEDRTPSQTFGKILLTPFAVAADIVLSPVYFVTIMWVAIAARHDGHISDAK
jgi:hypothetical protein